MSIESRSVMESAPHGDFVTIAALHVKEGRIAEARKLLQSAMKAERWEEAEIIRNMLGDFLV
jgi:hypothetical protein